MEVRCWGVRGSIPVTGPGARRYGGNTPCVEVRTGESRLIFDGGTGIRLLGRESDFDPDRTVEIFLTHFHLDHIQGLPFFGPLHDATGRIRITAPAQDDVDPGDLLGRNLSPVYFPVPLFDLEARISLRRAVEGEPLELPGCVVDSIRVDHPSTAHAYRVRAGGRIVVYAPDNELAGPTPHATDRFARFCEGADLLVHDAMYTDEEWTRRRGWGHSTFRQAVMFALDAGVARLAFFHHDPDRSDDDLDAIVAAEREYVARLGRSIEVLAAREGERLSIDGG